MPAVGLPGPAGNLAAAAPAGGQFRAFVLVIGGRLVKGRRGRGLNCDIFDARHAVRATQRQSGRSGTCAMLARIRRKSPHGHRLEHPRRQNLPVADNGNIARVRVAPLAVLRRDSVGDGPGHRLCAAVPATVQVDAAQPRRSRHGRDHRADRDPAIDADHRVLGAGSLRRVRDVQVGRVEPRPQSSARPRYPAVMGGRHAGALRADGPRRVAGGLSAGLARASQFLATQALNIGQATFELVVRMFVMLYLLFFLLRDGDELFRIIKEAVPLRAEQQRAIFSKFATVVAPRSKAPSSWPSCRARSAA